MRKKHWRAYTSNDLPPKSKLVELFTPLINSLVSLVLEEQVGPLDMKRRFYGAFTQAFYGRSDSSLSSSLLQYLCEYSRDDLTQQCYLFLIEIWDWYSSRWRQYKSQSMVFYDYVRTLLPKYLGRYLANEIRTYTAGLVPLPLSDISMEVESLPPFKLGWVILKHSSGPLAQMTVKQKYLLYLRYSKKLTIKQISSLVRQHRAKIEQEFSVINKLIGVSNATSRNHTKDPE